MHQVFVINTRTDAAMHERYSVFIIQQLVALVSFLLLSENSFITPFVPWTSAQLHNHEFLLLSAKEKQFYDPTLKTQIRKGSLNIKGMDIIRYQHFFKKLPRANTCVTRQHYNFHKKNIPKGVFAS